MKEYFLNMTGLFMRITTEQDILFTDKMKGFLSQNEHKEYSWHLEVKSCEELPIVGTQGYWKGLTCYQYIESKYMMFHFVEVGQKPFAVTCVEQNGKFTLLYLERYVHLFGGSSSLFNRIGLETILLQYKRIILHASFVKVRESGILFSAPSGVGKSTQAELWRQYVDADILNGDRAAVAKMDQGWMAWGIPYAGTSGIYRNESAHICAIVVLKQAKENKIVRLSAIQAVRFLYPEITVHQWEPLFVDKVITILKMLVCELPVFMLECLPEESAVELLYRTLEEGGYFYGS